MRSLDNLKTKTKLLGGFLLLAVIIAVLGVMSWLDISYIIRKLLNPEKTWRK